MSADSPASLGFLILWGLIATVAMTSILEGSRGLGFSRMSLPFLVGTFFVGNRRRALILGFSLYTIGGWLFAFLYYFLFASVGIYSWWFGALAGFLHGIFLLVTALPLLPFVHPRMASEYHGATAMRQLEPPGFLAMNYGYGTPLTTLLGQTVYGATLGGFLQLQAAMNGGLMSRGEAPTVVITGASAGVGRATALAFARRGWNVALLARDPTGLESAGNEVDQAGGRALLIPADVADENTIFTASEQVIKHWGTIDVWVNNAMVTMFAPLADISPAEFRRITEVTYLGYVFGTMAALKHMRLRNAGTIVQVGSALAYRAIPLQSAYCGAKFAIRGFTDALRSELQHEKSAIRITMVQLPAVNTPQFDWARNKMGRRPQPMPPIHQPEAIAEIIFRVSQEPPREFWVGFASVKAILGTMLAPGLLERFLARKGYEGQLTAEAQPPDLIDNLFEAAPSGHAIRGRFDDHANARVLSINPAILRTATTVVATTVAAAAAVMAVALFG